MLRVVMQVPALLVSKQNLHRKMAEQFKMLNINKIMDNDATTWQACKLCIKTATSELISAIFRVEESC